MVDALSRAKPEGQTRKGREAQESRASLVALLSQFLVSPPALLFSSPARALRRWSSSPVVMTGRGSESMGFRWDSVVDPQTRAASSIT